MYGTLLSNTQIQATLVTLTKSFQDIYFHWSQIQPVYVYMEHCFPIHVFRPRLPFIRTSKLHWSVQKKTCMLLLPRKLVVPPKQGHFGWKQSDWSSQLVLTQWKVHKDSQSGTRQTECGIKKRKAIEVFTSQGQLQTHFAGGQRGSWTWDIRNNEILP